MAIRRLLRISAWVALITVGVSVAGVLGWFFYTQMPCAEARQFEALYRDRPRPPDDGNAYIDAFGFAAPENREMHAHGASRIAWIGRMHAHPESEEPDPGKADIPRSEDRDDASSRLAEACRRGAARRCAEAFRAIAPDERLFAHEDLFLARYEEMLGRKAWYEIHSFSETDPFPEYAGIFEAQRLRMIRLRWAAIRGEGTAVRDALERDLVFWREVSRSADGLITRMLAIAAIRFHFTYANLVLAELPPGQQLEFVPPSWRLPLSDEERSMWRVLAGEYTFMSRAMRRAYDQGEPFTEDEISDELPARVLGSWLRHVAPRRIINDRARLYASVAREFEAPLDRYDRARDAVVAGSELDDAGDTTLYAFRSGSVEAMRRAALLVAQLRSRGVALADVSRELGKSDLRRPFDGQAFTWDEKGRSVLHPGPEKKRDAIVLYY